jgi:hypothetical protein
VVALNTLHNTVADSAWFVVQTLSRHEKVFRGQLQKRNVEHFLPTIKRLNQRTDRKKEVKDPLFGDTVLQDWLGRIGSPCFNLRLSFDWSDAFGRHEPIPEHEIDSLRTLVETHRSISWFICRSKKACLWK